MSFEFAELDFDCMGCAMRIVVEGGDDPHGAARAGEALLHEADRVLTRFDERSELCRLNADPRTAVPASRLLRDAVAAALTAARRSGGLVDPTLLTALEDAGYRESRRGTVSAPLAGALTMAPERRPAAASPARAWQRIIVGAKTIARPPGLRLDLGGSAKGFAADLTAQVIGRSHPDRFYVDCAGDIAIGGCGREPYSVAVEHPATGQIALELSISRGGVATSGIDRRWWRDGAGAPQHHLLDPSTGSPAWTGLAGVTAVAPSAAEAETLAKQALLSGPHMAAAILAVHGGVLLGEAGEVQAIALPEPRPSVRLSELEALVR